MKNVLYLTMLAFLCAMGLQAQSKRPCSFENVINRTTSLTSYDKYNANLDLLQVLRYVKDDFLGYIGVNRKRLRITFTSITKSKMGKDIYDVEGFSTVMKKNKRTFKGTFTLISHYQFTEPVYEDEPLKKGELEGFSTFSYRLAEDEALTATGVFEGKMIVLWFKGINKAPVYKDLFERSDDERNYQFLGTWTSYRTQQPSVASWGVYRIPCSDDFDLGEGDFYPDDKYKKYGWEDYPEE